MPQPLQACPACSGPLQIPLGFIDVLRIPTLAREIGNGAAQQEGDQPDRLAATDEPGDQPAYQPPEVKPRTVVATCRPGRSFALLLASAAWAAAFQKAKRKAFVADVIEELRRRQDEVGLPEEGESETSVASVVARGLSYLRNHQAKMNYDAYRQAGLPIPNAVMESTVQQRHQRVKGTEKFWCSEGAEAIVQLRADYLSDDEPLDDFFQRRQRDATGQRPYRRPAAA